MVAFNSINLTKMEINIDNLRKNIRTVRSKLGNSKLIAVVKSNAYGHGAKMISKYIDDLVDILAVATVSEAMELYEYSKKPILILGFIPEHELKYVVEYGFIPSIFDLKDAVFLNKLAQEQGKIIDIHISLDTGMTRLGYTIGDQALAEIIEISRLENINIQGIYTHFTASEEDEDQSRRQVETFGDFIKKLEENKVFIELKHISNSAGIVNYPDYNMNGVRLGISMYGYYSNETFPLEKTTELVSEICNLREVPAATGISYNSTYFTDRQSLIATIPVGYADGYSRSLSNKAQVLINGKRAPILGKVCMDQMMVDVTDIEAKLGDRVVLWGYKDTYGPSAEEIGDLSDSFMYEIFTMVGRRIPRVYLLNGKVDSVEEYTISNKS